MSYQVAIPSHRRAELLGRTTLRVLADGGVPPHRITVFIDEDDPDRDAYTQLTGVHMVAWFPTSGINAMRRNISAHYSPGTNVVCLDDDVTGVFQATTHKTLTPIADLDAFIRHAFTHTRQRGLSVWGVSAVANPYFMRPQTEPSEDLKFLIATMWGFVSRPGHPMHDTTVAVKEDYDTSLRAWWYDGGVVRFNDVTVKADHYRAPGGCQDYRTGQTSADAAAQLIHDWPGIVRLNERRKSGHAEILLNRRARHAGQPLDIPPPGVAPV